MSDKYILGGTVIPPYIQGKKVAKDTNINIVKEFMYVPWIALRYFSPYITTNTDIVIQYYITDHAHSDYIANNTGKLFKVVVEFNGTIITDVVSSGDNTLNIGSSSDEGEMYFTIKCIDLSNNVESPIQFVDVYIKDTFEILDSETYYMTADDLTTYGIDASNNTTESVMTGNIDGINNMIRTAKESGYKKLVMYNPNGNTNDRSVYRIQPYNTRNRAIIVPSYFTLDLNNSKIKQHVSYSNVDYGYGLGNGSLMIATEKSGIDSHLINGILEGDWDEHDTTIDSGNTFEGEGYDCSAFGGKFCSMENLEICWFTGYTVCASNVNGGYASLKNNIGEDWTHLYIDMNGNEINTNECLTSTYINCASSGFKYLSANNYLGYGGINGSYIEIIHFYDSNKNYMLSYKVRQYGLVKIPDSATFCRVTLYSDTVANNFKVEFSDFRTLTQCQFKNLYIHDTRTCGMATGIYNRLLVENCTFARSGHRITPVSIDVEDGYQYAENYYFKNNRITEWASTQTGGFICTCGYNMVFEGDLSGFTLGIGKVKGLTLHNISSDLEAFQFILKNRDITGFSILDGITFKGDIETGVDVKNNKIIYRNCKFLKSINRRGVADGKYTNYCILDNCEFDLTNAYEFTNCKVIGSTIDLKPYGRGFRGVHFYDCTITSTGTSTKSLKLYSRETILNKCIIKNINIEVAHDIPVTIKNCTLENVKFTGTYKDNIIQENNIII